MTVVAVVGLYDLLLFWPAQTYLKAHAFADFGDALPAPAQFIVDTHWFLLLAVGILFSLTLPLSQLPTHE